MAKGPYKLKLTKLQWLSSVDAPAQGDGARALLIKRKGQHEEIEFSARVSKLNDELGLVFGHAFSSSLDGGVTPHVDYQADAIDPDFVKTAMEFMEAGGPTDVNHDCAKDGRIVFAWPLVPEVNEAMGIKSDVIGLAVAVKPSAETYAKFKSGELAGFSLYGTGVREPLGKQHKEPVTLKSAPTRVVKATLYTDEVEGHQHEICVYEDGGFYVRSATMTGAEYSHSHGCVFENGQLVILADSGHSHVLAEGQPGVAVVPQDAIVVVAARDTRASGASKSTRSVGSQQPALTSREQSTMKTVVLTEAQFAHYSKLSGADAEAYLAKTAAERDADIAKALAADPIEVEFNGQAYRKSAGPAVIELAKAAKAQAETIAKRDEAIEKAEIRKQAAEVLGGMPGDDATHDFIIGALRKSGDQVMAQKAYETLKGMKATSSLGKRAPGIGGVDVPAGVVTKKAAFEALDNGLKAFCVEKNIARPWIEGLDAFIKTDAGRALYEAHEAAKAAEKN